MRRILVILSCAILTFAVIGCSDEQITSPDGKSSTLDNADDSSSDVSLRPAPTDKSCGMRNGSTTYEVIIENLTPPTGEGSSQPFSPAILTTHRHGLRAIEKRGYATDELAQVAEDAVNGPLVDKLNMSRRVSAVVQGDGVIFPGSESRFEITASGGARRLSAVFMLVNTNDAFGWLDGVHLPLRGEKVFMVGAYDAGTEVNSESTSDIPGPCCGSPGMGEDEHMKIRHHDGIQGTGDLDPDTWGWSGPVAKVTIRRLAPLYQVTLENLTPATVPGGSQVFSPPVLATHNPGFSMFRVGRYASEALAALAEDGDTSGMEELLNGSHRVGASLTGDGPILPGNSAMYEIEAGRAARRLSLAFMLVNTNDAFGGGNRIRLPDGGSVAYYLPAYDAGSELNTELATDIPGPCCGSPGAGTDEHERIMMHPGLTGEGDLDVGDYGWDDPVAKLTITRVR